MACPNKTNVHPAHPELLYRYVYAVYHVNMLNLVGFCFKWNVLNKYDICKYSFWIKLHYDCQRASGEKIEDNVPNTTKPQSVTVCIIFWMRVPLSSLLSHNSNLITWTTNLQLSYPWHPKDWGYYAFMSKLPTAPTCHLSPIICSVLGVITEKVLDGLFWNLAHALVVVLPWVG